MADDLQQVTVLLVDDEENILRALQRLLMDENFSIETAASGEAALEKLQTLENVGLIVSDQRMPGMNGAEFLGRSPGNCAGRRPDTADRLFRCQRHH